jgi:proteasome lid subunit RPN8/RPN11
MREQVVITAPARAALQSAVRAAAPNEACGVLFGECEYGTWWAIDSIEQLPNEASSPERAYLISSATVRKLERAATDNHTQVVGFFHSHPEGATPSPTDLELAWPGYLYLIADASTQNGLSGWTLADDRSAFARVSITER